MLTLLLEKGFEIEVAVSLLVVVAQCADHGFVLLGLCHSLGHYYGHQCRQHYQACRRPLAQERYIAHVLFPPYIYNMRNPIRLLCSLHSRMAITACSALRFVEHFDCGQHRLLVACDDELRDALSVVDGEGILREVDEQHH